MGPIESGNVVNQSHPAHLGAHGLKHTGTEPVLVAKWAKGEKKLVLGVFELDENGQEDLLVIFVPREQEACQLIQSLNTGNLIGVELNLCSRHILSPYPFPAKQGIGWGIHVFR